MPVKQLLSLSWARGDWRYSSGIVEAYFKDGMIEIPVGKSRRGAFYLSRVSEDGWQVAPVRFPKNRPESYDLNGYHSDFLHLYGAPSEVNDELSQI